MKLNPPVSLSEAAKILGCKFVGPENHQISGLNEIHCVVEGDITFVDVEKYYDKALNSAATTILINKEVSPPDGKGLLVTDDPFNAFNALAEHFSPRNPVTQKGTPETGSKVKIGDTVTFGNNVRLADNVEIGHNTVIGSHVTIGEGTIIYPNVTINDRVTIGKHCIIQPGAVIGGEAFYFKSRPDSKTQLLTKGRVEIHDHVNIGANTTVDAGVTDLTQIGEYTKIDNQCQIGHDTIIGKRCIIAAQVGIAGVVKIGDDCFIWGQAGITPKLEIGDKTVLYGKTGVMNDLEGGQAYGGMIADTARNFLRKENALRKLIDLMPELEKLLKEKDD